MCFVMAFQLLNKESITIHSIKNDLLTSLNWEEKKNTIFNFEEWDILGNQWPGRTWFCINY